MLTPIDVVLRDPTCPGIWIGGAIPIGLLAPIRFQPHLGDDREQSFVVDGESGTRRLLWRTSRKADHDAGETRFLVVPLDSKEWTGLLDHSVSVPQVLSSARAGAAVRLGRIPGGAGIVEVTPAKSVVEALGDDGVPVEHERHPSTGERQDRRSSWLALPSGRLLDSEKSEHADELRELRGWRETRGAAESATTADGTTVEAFRNVVLRTTADGTETVRRYGQQLTARVVVEREQLR